MRLLIGLGLLAATGLVHCKKIPTADAELQTLQDFASNKNAAGNQCQGANPADAPVPELASRLHINQSLCSTVTDASSADYALCQDLRRTLTAVPREVQKAFGDLGGSILIASDAGDACSQVFSDPKSPQYAPDAERRKVAGCVVFLKDQAGAAANGAGDKLVMLIAASKADIGHNIVRMFGFFFGQSVPRLIKTKKPDGSVSFVLDDKKATDPVFATFKTELVSKFFNDMVRLETEAANKDTYKLDNLIPMIGVNGPAQIRGNVKAAKVDVLEGVTFAMAGEVSVDASARLIRAERLRDTVFAEGFDSMNCTAAIRQETLDVSFKATGAHYQTINAAILAKARSISMDLAGSMALAGNDAKEKAAAPAADGMALAGMQMDPMMMQQMQMWLQQMYAGGGMNAFSSMGGNFGGLQAAAQPYMAANPYGASFAPSNDVAQSSNMTLGKRCSGCNGTGGNCTCPGGSCSSGNCASCNGSMCSCSGGVCPCSMG